MNSPYSRIFPLAPLPLYSGIYEMDQAKLRGAARAASSKAYVACGSRVGICGQCAAVRDTRGVDAEKAAVNGDVQARPSVIKFGMCSCTQG